MKDARRRKLFRRMYRMEEHSFNKVAELLRPILERNDYYASKKAPHRVRPRVRKRVGIPYGRVVLRSRKQAMFCTSVSWMIDGGYQQE